MAEAIVEQLASAGYATEANRLPPEDLAQVIVTGETDLFAFGWVAPATSSDAVIPPLLTVDSAANVARVDSPTVAVLLAEAAITADDQRRLAAAQLGSRRSHGAGLDRAHRHLGQHAPPGTGDRLAASPSRRLDRPRIPGRRRGGHGITARLTRLLIRTAVLLVAVADWRPRCCWLRLLIRTAVLLVAVADSHRCVVACGC